MVSDDGHMMKFVTEALKNEAILCLVKPCDLSDICNIWNHVCRKRIASEKHDSKRKLPLANNIIRRVDPMFKPFATLNRAMNNTETSQEYSAVFKPIHMNIFGNDVGTSTTRKTDKGKQPMDSDQPLDNDTYRTKRKESKPRINWTKALHGKFLEALNTLGKQNAYPSEILKHMNVPGLTRNHVASHVQKLHEGEKVIKKPRLVPVVQIGDDLQSHGSKRSGQLTLSSNNESLIQSSSLQTPLRKLNSAGMSYMSLDNIKARMQESALSSLPVPQPNTTSTMSNSSYVTDQSVSVGVAPDNNLGEVGAINLSNGVENGNSRGAIEAQTPFAFDSYNSLDASGIGAMSEPLAQFDCFGIPIEAWPVTGMGSVDDHGLEDTMLPLVDDVVVEEENCNMGDGDQTSNFSPMTNSKTGGGGAVDSTSPGLEDLGAATSPNFFGFACNSGGGDAETSITNQSLEDLALHEFVSHELGGLYHPQLDLQGNGENLFMGFLHHSETTSNGFSSLELEPAGSVGVSFPGEGSNSTQAQMPLPDVNSNGVYLGGVEEGRDIEDDSFLHMTQFDVERTMQLLDEVDAADLINGPWQFQ
ncbi:hypothetical protein L6452_13373 [Arctium lappa]|uniref:Uncharacterized protein n=1 Tax=Arctium lappa TaxID=4217 RepID=A0ACB9CI20_ARCLA|nr:hypothetical protein L6452_13373 [Arctium lappa]